MAGKRKEIVATMSNGNTIRCGRGEVCVWGAYLRVCDKHGRELLYWHSDEFGGESVIGAVFALANKRRK